MSPSPNGSNIYRHSIQIPIRDVSSVGEARRQALSLCATLDFDETQTGRVAIVVNELGNNLAKYSQKGRILLTTTGFIPDGIDIIAIDEGPGLDVNDVMQDGFTTGTTPGTGMGAVARQSDQFDIYSQMGKGTVILSRILRKANSQNHFEVAAIGLPLNGEIVSGDGWVAREDGNEISVMMSDGLGHGVKANQATVEAADAFQSSNGLAIQHKIDLIHGRLKSTRGAAIFLLNVKGNSLEFSGIGNIRTFWQSQTKAKVLISQNGTAGVQMRTVRTLNEPWDGTGYVILHSDGILGRFELEDYPGLLIKHSAIVAAIVMRDFHRGTDDASILVIRKIR